MNAIRYGDSEEKMKMYITLMTAYGATAGIPYKFGGTVANTLQSHRLIQSIQDTKGPAVTDALINSLYRQYFEQEQHPSSHATLLQACRDAGIPESEAKKLVEDESEGVQDVKMKVQEQRGNGVDSVPYVVVEGRRRDFTVQGAQEVADYRKILEQVVKECS